MFRSKRHVRAQPIEFFGTVMGGNSDSDEFEEDEGEEIDSGEEVDLDRVFKDMDIAKRRTPKAGEPAWRRLEKRLEQKLTKELTSDFEDYTIEQPGLGRPGRL